MNKRRLPLPHEEAVYASGREGITVGEEDTELLTSETASSPSTTAMLNPLVRGSRTPADVRESVAGLLSPAAGSSVVSAAASDPSRRR